MDLSYAEAAKYVPKDVEEMWVLVEKTSVRDSTEVLPVKNRRGWRTIRIFVSSTFRDFLSEREVLVKELFPDLRLWCEERKLRLIECDLKWGVPAGTTGSDTIQICLGELDRCYEENHVPFFLNLCAERVGWIPSSEELSDNLASHYGWVHGLSVTEMEIVHGALRRMNPNALFMIREADSLEGLPDHVIEYFQENGDLHKEKLQKLKTKIAEVFPTNHHFYKVKGNVNSTDNIRFEGLDGEFYQKIFGFFKDRIEKLYPLELLPEDPLEVQREAHTTFMETRSKSVLGRDQQLQEIQTHIKDDKTRTPLILVGKSGSGKSSIVARSARDVSDMVEDGKLLGKVFVHFVGATPGSTDLVSFLKRLASELSPDIKETITDLNGYVHLVRRLLSKEDAEPVFLFIDAVNQMDEDKQYYLARWLPCELSPNVRVVLSTIDETDTHSILKKFDPPPKEIPCGPLDEESREQIVANILRDYTKELHSDQMKLLISKKGSSNPLWLAIACEELRVEAVFETVTSMIEAFPDELIDIEANLISRLVAGENGEQLKAALILLEVSRHGLLETELLELLAKKKEDSTETNDSAAKTKPGCKETIPARDWAVIYRNIKQMLRPCGNLGDGRLDFYHRSLSKAVRKLFMSGSEEEVKETYTHWHGVLADFFEASTDLDRKAEELPYHLEQLGDKERMVKCLVDWDIFNRLYDEHFAVELIRFWKAAGGYEVAGTTYKDSLSHLKETSISKIDFSEQQYKVGNFLRAGGQIAQAYEMLKGSVAIEEEEGTAAENPLRLAQMCHWMAYCKRVSAYHAVGGVQPTSESKIASFEEAIAMYLKSNTYLDNLSGEESDVLRARSDCGRAHVMLKVSEEKGTHDTDEFQNDAAPLIQSSVDTLERYNAIRYMIDALGTQSLIVRNGVEFFEEKKRIRMRALDLCLRNFGEVHDLFVTKSRNFGGILKKAGDYESAYDWYTRSLTASLKLYGPDHSYTKTIEKDMADHLLAEVAERRVAENENKEEEKEETKNKKGDDEGAQGTTGELVLETEVDELDELENEVDELDEVELKEQELKESKSDDIEVDKIDENIKSSESQIARGGEGLEKKKKSRSCCLI